MLSPWMKSDPAENYFFRRLWTPPDPENAKPRRGQPSGQFARQHQQQGVNVEITALRRHAARLARAA